MSAPDLTELEALLGFRFQRSELLTQALTHSSLANERSAKGVSASQRDGTGPKDPAAGDAIAGDNEQLEFLGDTVLGFVTSDVLFRRFPHFREGQLSKWRAHLVSARHLLKVAHQFRLDRFVMLGRGEELSGGRHKSAILTDAVEAIIGAIYLDSGLEAARTLIVEKILDPELGRMASETQAVLALADYKSTLQEFLQARGHAQPSYSLVSEEGPPHRKRFTIEVRAGDAVCEGEGASRKKAEQQAARLVLDQLSKEDGTSKG